MPAIYLFDRRTLYGGDDLHLLALSTAAVRGVQLLCYSIIAYHILNHVQHTDAHVARAAALTTSLGDEMYVRRRLSESDDDNNNPPVMNLGISLLEYAWMDAVNTYSTDACRHSHLFPLLLMSYTVAGVAFGIGSLCLLTQIYRTSSKGCPTIGRHPRTELMQQYLEWLFLPLNVLHFLIWLLGISATIMGFHYSPCHDASSSSSSHGSSVQPSTWFVVLWIFSGVVLLLSQGVEVVWNFVYVLVLHHHDPHALEPPINFNSSNHGSLAGYEYNGLEASVHEHHELTEQMWADRCQNICRYLGMGTCYMFGGRELYGNGAMHYGDFARAMADYLETRGVLDVVPSDILVGFLVLQQVQNQRRLKLRSEVLSEAFSSNNPSSMAGFSSSSNNNLHGSGGSSTQLYDHRANAKSPNGMSLTRTLSQQHLLKGPQQQLQQDTSSTPLIAETIDYAQRDPPSPPKAVKRSVLLQSMGSGSLQNVDANSSEQGGIAQITTSARSAKVIVDQSHPPVSPNIHKAIKRGAEGASSTAPRPPFGSNKSFQRLLSEHNHADVATLEEGARYSKYALAIYSWYLYLYANPVTGVPKLGMKILNNTSKCCFMSKHNHENEGIPRSASSSNLHQAHAHAKRRWEGDNLCEAHKHALLLAAGIENEADLVYVQFKSSFNENPYCILLDHETEAVVVAVRGTFSLEDCVTDVLIEPESMEHLGDEFGFAELARGQYVHGGVLACARNVYRDLKRHGSLDFLLGTKYPHYQLRLVGHSLGAATSTLLGFMFRQTYPTLRCFNYSPPGCTLTWDMAVQCQTWCTSFVLDSEVVPRMSFDSLEYLRDEVLDLIGRIKVSKLEVAGKVVTKNLWCRGKTNTSAARVRNEYDPEAAFGMADEIGELLDDLLLPAGEAPPADAASTSYRQQLERFQSIQSERRVARGTRRAIRLFPPGKILHLVKTDEEDNCMVNVAKCLTCCMSNAGSLYTPVWIGNGDLNEIVISPTMGTDHFPDRMVEELHGIVRNFGVSTQYR